MIPTILTFTILWWFLLILLEDLKDYLMKRIIQGFVFWLDWNTLDEEHLGLQPQVLTYWSFEEISIFTKLFHFLCQFLGRLCIWNHPDTADRRLDYTFETFERFRNSLQLECSKETTAAVLTVTPNITWPDVVYYNRYVI